MINPETIFQESQENIPAKCQNCAVQCAASMNLMKLLFHKAVMTAGAEGLMGEDMEGLNGLIRSVIPETEWPDLKKALLNSSAQGLDVIDEKITEEKEEMTVNSRSCDGTFNMRASKNGVTYTAALCTSARVYTRGGQDHLSVHIRTR